ncbi:metalloregulator ArsR/SmtB family transcription factor [Hyphomicrobium sp. CS1GBMeth3]|uniref:ArsR/SmtB family transcription factor n=1 Tax=Hyphomicrobium sp. CS1GBMeth3 TaxID=1892845 RepID=UPI000A602FD5|nr:metalloregulator ArsR/SmtB family transcription factor [Hyphomicrobium sp. CS1GBMeth3]
MSGTLDSDNLVLALKAAAESTRLRILLLLAAGEHNVKDLTQILGQSQPRISRHLKLLAEAGLIERFREGSWVYFHVSDRSDGGRLVRRILEAVDTRDPLLRRDSARAEALKHEREAAAQAYFRKHAADWDRIRTLYVSESAVESAIVARLDGRPLKLLVDLGTGTGRMLEVLADRYERGLGLDVNQPMLAYAASRLKTAGLGRAEVRHGDIYNVALPDGAADGVVIHQVLHYLSEPAHAVREAARILAPGGRLLIVDFAPHGLEELRERHAHERLGFEADQVTAWLEEAGLSGVEVETFSPEKDDDRQQLTVTLWLAKKPERADASAKPQKLERIGS